MLRRIAVLGLAAASVGLAAVASAGAAPPVSKVVGAVTGTTSYTFGTNGCDFVHETFALTVTSGPSRTTSVDLEGCVSLLALPEFGYRGTFTINGRGKPVSGTVSGTITNFSSSTGSCAPGQQPADLDFVLTPNGPAHGAHRNDTLTFHGVWCFRGNIPAVDDPVVGELVAS
jgi:hypothetical protein